MTYTTFPRILSADFSTLILSREEIERMRILVNKYCCFCKFHNIFLGRGDAVLEADFILLMEHRIRKLQRNFSVTLCGDVLFLFVRTEMYADA